MRRKTNRYGDMMASPQDDEKKEELTTTVPESVLTLSGYRLQGRSPVFKLFPLPFCVTFLLLPHTCMADLASSHLPGCSALFLLSVIRGPGSLLSPFVFVTGWIRRPKWCRVVPAERRGVCVRRRWWRWSGQSRWYQFTGLMRHDGTPQHLRFFTSVPPSVYLLINLLWIVHPHLMASFKHKVCGTCHFFPSQLCKIRRACSANLKVSGKLGKGVVTLCFGKGSDVHCMMTCYLHFPADWLCDKNTGVFLPSFYWLISLFICSIIIPYIYYKDGFLELREKDAEEGRQWEQGGGEGEERKETSFPSFH